MHDRRNRTTAAFAATGLIMTIAALGAGSAGAADDGVTAQPSLSRVVVDTPVTVTGTTRGHGKVVVQRKDAGGWRRVGTVARADSTGDFTAPFPTGWYGEHLVRARSKGNSARSEPFTVTVDPDYDQHGSARSWKRLNYKGIRWNPCTPIKWRFNRAGGFKGDTKLVKAGFREVTRATGLQFQYVGTTKKKAVKRRQLSYANIIVDWQTRKENRKLGPGALGIAYPVFVRRTEKSVAEMIASDIVLNRREVLNTHDTDWYDEDGNPITEMDELNDWVEITIMHELGHGVGLDHVDDDEQVMNASLSTGTFGRGDLTGLRKLGAYQGCIKKSVRTQVEDWRPQPGARPTQPQGTIDFSRATAVH